MGGSHKSWSRRVAHFFRIQLQQPAASQPAPSTPTGARVWLSSLFLLVELFIFRYFLPSKGKTKFIILFLRCYRESKKKRLCFYPLKPQLEITSHQAIQFPPLVVTFHLLLIIFRMFHCFAVAAWAMNTYSRRKVVDGCLGNLRWQDWSSRCRKRCTRWDAVARQIPLGVLADKKLGYVVHVIIMDIEFLLKVEWCIGKTQNYRYVAMHSVEEYNLENFITSPLNEIINSSAFSIRSFSQCNM